MEVIEIIGYVGSVLVAVSLMMSAIVKLRIINFLGAAIFSAYGFIIGALPVGFLNAFIAFVDIYYLYEIFSAKEFFKVLEFRYDSEYFKYFLEFHKDDIKKFSPNFKFSVNNNWNILFVLRNSVPAGLVCAEKINNNSLYVKLDYAIPGYRDFKMGKYVYNKVLKESRIKKIFTDSGNEEHKKYLTKMGFVESVMDSKQVFMLQLKE